MINTILRAILNKNPDYRLLTDIELIIELTKDISFFKRLKKESGIEPYKQLSERLTYQQGVTDQYIIEQGDSGRHFYIVLNGRVQVRVKGARDTSDHRVKVIESGGSFGDLALRRDTSRSASVQWLTTCDFAVLDKDDYKKILGRLDTRRRDFLYELLIKHSSFKAWGRKKLEHFMYCFREKVYLMKQYIYKEGDVAKQIYLIKHGTIQMRKQVFMEGKNRIIYVGDLGQGEIFGEEDVLANEPRIYSALCISDKAEIVVIPGSEYLKRLKFEDQIPIVKDQIKVKIQARDNRISYLKHYKTDQIRKSESLNTPRLQTANAQTSSNLRRNSAGVPTASSQDKFNISAIANLNTTQAALRAHVTNDMDSYFTVSPPKRTPIYVSPFARIPRTARNSKNNRPQSMESQRTSSSALMSIRTMEAMQPNTKRQKPPQSAKRPVNIHMEKRRRLLSKSKNRLAVNRSMNSSLKGFFTQ